jgi:hypothetical protein
MLRRAPGIIRRFQGLGGIKVQGSGFKVQGKTYTSNLTNP